MNWSPTIFRIKNIPVKMHVTFLLLLGFEAWSWRSHGYMGMLFGIAITMLLFACVILHELGHALAAGVVRIPVREIMLLPIGGVAYLARRPRKPVHELLIAVAGPMVNIGIALLLFPFVQSTNLSSSMWITALPGPDVLPSWTVAVSSLYVANVMLVLFNMLPAFPLDGGRVLRALIAMVASERQATTIATMIGQGVAVVIGLIGILYGNVMLPLTAVLIFLSAGNEHSESQARTMLETRLVGDAYNRNAITLSPADKTSRVVDYILTSYQPDFAVIKANSLLGIVTREEVMNTLANDPSDVFLAGIMQRDFIKVAHTFTLDEVRTTIVAANNGEVAAVYRGEEFLGLVSLTDIAEALAVIDYVARQKTLQQIDVS